MIINKYFSEDNHEMTDIKLELWYLLHDRRKFFSDLYRKLHVLTLKRSQYYPECERFYSLMNVKGKIVIDIGCDFGTTPMYFLSRGAVTVIGFSKDKQYFHDNHYRHYDVDQDPHVLPTAIQNIKRIKDEMTPPHIVLKSDCEGCEWNFTKEFIETFEDWIIAVHTPITNEKLYGYIKANGENIGDQISGRNLGVQEIGIYRKVSG